MSSRKRELIQFIKRLYPDRSEIALHEPKLGREDEIFVQRAVSENCVASVGEYVKNFEDQLRSLAGRNFAVATVNGTSALHLALLAAGVQAGEEVITQPLNFIAGCNAIHYCGAHPSFVDVSRATLGMDSESLKEFLFSVTERRNDGELWNKKTNRKIRACIPMNTFGHRADLREIKETLRTYKIKMIVDSAEALGSTAYGSPITNWGDVAVLSFNGNKIVTSGGGGALLLDDEDEAEKIRFLATTAKVEKGYESEHTEVGFNYRMPNLNAALGCAQIRRLQEFVDIKREIARRYQIECERIGVEFFVEPEESKSNYWLNCIFLKDLDERNEFIRMAHESRVHVRPAWRLMHHANMNRTGMWLDLSNSEWLVERIVNLPSGVSGSAFDSELNQDLP